MKGALFGDQIEGYKDAFVYNGVYEIANAPIKPCDEKWKTNPTNLNYQMSFGRQTVIQTIDEHVGPIVPDYKCISKIPKVVNAAEKFDLLGVVLYVDGAARKVVTSQNRELLVREIVVVDQSSEQPLIISAWNDLAETECALLSGWAEKFKVVGFTALKVSTHKGFSMATTMSTTFIHSPTGDMATILEQCMQHDFLSDAQARILDARNTLQEERHRLQITIPESEFEKVNAYLGCSNCGKKVDIPAGHSFTCGDCFHKGAMYCPRISFNCNVADDTGYLPVTIFTADAEKIFGMSAPDLFRIKNTDDRNAFGLLAERLRKHHTIIEVGPKEILARNNVLQWVLKKVVGDEPTEQIAGEQVTQFSAALMTKHITTTSSTVDPTTVGIVKPKPAHTPSTPEQTNKSSSLIRGSPIVDEILAQVTVASALLNKFDVETTATHVSDHGEEEPIGKV
ncbi:hypothetical protein RND81_01G047900 [Saponaria officinalis]|uniref:Replication factor A C-terminal domain-containing protein n=1 Tax=Saponaria officinalis TaxID=3572 RepID=A0AAW1N5R6_SAPOF